MVIRSRNLAAAVDCLETMKSNGSYRGHRIGILNRQTNSLVGGYERGQAVIYREQLYPSDAEMQMGEYMSMQQRPTGRVTVELPMTRGELEEQKEKGSLLATIGTMINVPRSYVNEVKPAFYWLGKVLF